MTTRRRGCASRRRFPPILFPTDANIVNVKNAPYNAKGDGVTDDTAAILQACLDHDRVDSDTTAVPVAPLAPWTVYLPEGTYLISDSIAVTGCTLRIIGAGVDRTRIRLKDNATGFTSSGTPKYVLKTGEAVLGTGGDGDSAAAFANYVQHLTVDVGSGNLGAVGIRFDGANVSAMEHVIIRSSDATKRGLRGLSFEANPGAALVRDVTIDGFDTGIWYDQKSISNNIVLCDIRLYDQRVVPVLNSQANLAFENLTVTGAPGAAIQHTISSASTIVVGGSLNGTGSTAITAPQDTYVYLRDVTTSGYGNIVTVGATAYFAGKTSLTEWASYPYWAGATKTSWTESGGYAGIRLPIRKSPVYYHPNPSAWASVVTFGATPGNSADDDSAAIQAAIDSGAEVVYFPYGAYKIALPVYVRGAVRKIDFMGSAVDKSGSGKIIVQGTAADTVFLENVATRCEIQQNSSSTLVVRNWANLSGLPVLTTGTSGAGDVFVDNAGPHLSLNITQPVNVWVRQVNRERQGGITVTAAAKVWEFGDNIEDGTTDAQPAQITVSGGSYFEQIGGVFDYFSANNFPQAGVATTQITDSHATVLMPVTIGQVGTVTETAHWLNETRSGVTVKDLYDTDEDRIGAVFRSVHQRAFGIPYYVSPA